MGVLAFSLLLVLKMITPRLIMMRMKTLVTEMRRMTIMSGASSTSSLAPGG